MATPTPKPKAKLKDLKKVNEKTMKAKAKPFGVPKFPDERSQKVKNANKVEELIQNVTNRYRVTAREARDIITAAGTAATSASSGFQGKESLQNISRQVKETVKAAKTGKKGTASDIARKNEVSKVTSGITGKSMGKIVTPTYTTGQKRK